MRGPYTTQARLDLFRLLNALPGLNARDVTVHLGGRQDSNEATIRRARRAGMVESCPPRFGKGVGLRLTDAGRARLNP